VILWIPFFEELFRELNEYLNRFLWNVIAKLSTILISKDVTSNLLGGVSLMALTK